MAAPAPPQKSSHLRRFAADPAISTLKGAIGLPESVVGLVDMATGGHVGKGLEAAGYRPKEAREFLDTLYSPEQQAANARVQDAKGFIPTIKEALSNPSVIAHTAIESAPSMIGAAGYAKGLIKLSPKLAPLTAAAIGEGLVSAGQSAEQIRQQNPNGLLSAKQIALSGGSGAATAGLGLAGGKVAKKLGIADIDTMLAGGSAPEVKKGLLRSVFEGVISEGALEELPQSAQEQMAQNLATGRPWDEGVAEAGALGMMSGGVMGGGGNVVSHFSAKPATREDRVAQIQDALLQKVSNPETDLQEIAAQQEAVLTSIEPSGPAVTQAAYADLTPEEKYYADLNDGLVNPYTSTEATQQMVSEQPGYNPEAPFPDERAQGVERQLAADQARLDAFDSANPVIPSPAEEAAPFVRDYEGVKNHLESNQFFEVGQKNGKPVTRSDFSAALQQSYPSLVGTPKGDVISALNAQIKGRKLTEKQQEVIDKLNTDLDRYQSEARRESIAAEQQQVLDRMQANTEKQRSTSFPFGYNVPGYEGETAVPYESLTPEEQALADVNDRRNDASQSAPTDGTVAEPLLPGVPARVAEPVVPQTGPNQAAGQGIPNPATPSDAIRQGEPLRPPPARGEVTPEQPKFSTTPAPATLDLKTIQRSFPGQKVTAVPDGHEVALKNGAKVRVTAANEIQFNVADAEAGLGRKLKAGEKPVASWQTMPGGGVITLTEAGVGELDHEVFHTAMALALSKGERTAVLKKHGSEEQAAVAYKEFRDGQGSDTFFQKVKDFFLKVRDMFVKDADTVFRKLASGKAWEQATPEQRRDALAKFMTAWHGSPHDHDKFDSSKIGTGEGAQAYGYGLYFAGNKEVAEWYRDQLTKNNPAAYNAWVGQRDLMFQLFKDERGALYDQFKQEIEAWDGRGGHLPDSVLAQYFRDVYDAKRDDRISEGLEDAIKSYREYYTPPFKDDSKEGRLYQVELAPKEDEYLLWDKPLSGQSEQVREALKADPALRAIVDKEEAHRLEVRKGLQDKFIAAGKEPPLKKEWSGLTGQEIYKAVSKARGADLAERSGGAIRNEPDDRWASEALHAAGIRGIKYLDGTSRNVASTQSPRIAKMESDIAHLKESIANPPAHWAGQSNMVPEAKARLTELEAALEKVKRDENLNYNYVIFNDEDVEIVAKFSFGIDKVGKALATTKWGGRVDRIVSYFMPMDRIFDSFKERADLAPVKDLITSTAKEYELQTAVQDDHQTEAGLRLNKAFEATGSMTKVGGADVWYKQDEAKAKQLNSVMQKGRLWGFAADKELAEQDWTDETWEAGRMPAATGLSLKAAFAQFKAEYNRMTPEMQAAYLSLRDFNKESRDDIIKIRERIINEMTSLSDETRTNLIEKIRKQFQQVKGDYFTLGRMGEYVVSIKTADQVDAEGNIVKRGEVVGSARYNDKADYLAAADLAVADPLSFAQALPGARADLDQKGELVAVYMHAPAQSRLQANIPQQFIEKLKGLVSGIEMKDLRKELRAIQRDLTKGIEAGEIAVPDGVTEVMARLAKAQTHQAMEQAQQDLEKMLGNHAQEQALLGEVHAAIDAAGMTAEIAEALKEDFDQAYLAALPETSIMKNYVKSKNLPGFNEDMLHSFAVYHQKFARTKAFATHGRKISDGLALMEKRGMGKDKAFTGEVSPEQSAAIGEFAKLVRDRQQAVLTEKVSPAIRKLTKFPFLWYMTSPSVLLVQSTQPFTVTHPFLAARFGQSKSMASIMKAYQRQFKQEFTDDKLLAFNEQHRELIRKLKDMGTTRDQINELTANLSPKDKEMLAMALTPSLNISLSHEEMEFAMSGETPNNRVAEKLGLFMSVSEAMSRKAGFLASFGLKYQATGNFADALDLGTEAVRQTLFSYSQANRPAVLTGSTGRFFGQFQIFRLQMVSHIAKLVQDSVWFNSLEPSERSRARRELTTLLGMHFVVGGAMGVPVVGNLAVLFMKAFHGLWGDDDEPYDAEEELKKALGDGAIAKGVPAWVGMDLSKRVGAGGIASLFQSKPPEKAKGAELAGWYAMQLAGPTFSTLANGYVAAGEAFETGDWGKALAQSAPKPVRDMTRAYQMSTEGVVTAGGKTVIPAEDLNIYQVGLAALGVNPLEMALKSEEAGRVARYSAQVSERRALLVSKFAEAVLDGDQEDVDKAVDRVIKFNETMPAYGLKASDLVAGARKRQMDKMGIDSKAQMKNNMFFGDTEEGGAE